MTTIETVLERIADRRPRIIDLSLGRIERVLARLGDPHLSLPKTIHVAGTNGKGSTIAFLKTMLSAAGHSVHVYTSPHLVRFNERVLLAGEEVSDEQFIEILTRVDQAAGKDKLTHFETITAAAFAAFSETPADFLLLEVGLGGRLDATNVIANPAASIVTPVGLDHEAFLGDTIELVAAEKAGIFRDGAPAVIGRQSPAAHAVLRAIAEERGAAVFAHGSEWDVYEEHGRLVYQSEFGVSDLELPRMAGRHQLDNAGLAIAALQASKINISDMQISDGINSAHWPARMQRLGSGPLVDLANELQGGPTEIWLDGGHNPHAARAIATAIGELEARSPRPLIMVVGMQGNKDAAGYFAEFKGIVRETYCVAADTDSAMSRDDLTAIATAAGLRASSAPSIIEALKRAWGTKFEFSPRILICGSLYLAGEVLRDHK
ncbi:MAG: bifunctional folylpolyglutamate synthase/dihydrofolate synthase [Marinicaulis sp.]|nr:bifunctional folylpolyglutamate synthase/dihydrofolate synthase [Marinicaulis sp.]NNE42278.1 bifunctional folylpolyglutamate synthase/dihydrofolate synthase [Marinicaulis sp.]NNL88650.1 bifunctional folylpolyglutamate synthase/dihydrofolate synthase [Marinicaulis sp.]